MPFSDLGILLGDVSLAEIEIFTRDPMRAQTSLLRKILRRNRNSELGRKYNFKDIKSINDFRRAVPLSTYEDYAPYVERMMRGERNLMYTGPNIRYATSSGSVGKPKILPKGISDLWKMQCIGFSCSTATAAHHLRRLGKRLPAQMGPLVLVLSGHTSEDGKKMNGAGQIPLDFLKFLLPTFCTSPVSLMYPEHEELVDTAYFQLRFALANRKVTSLGSMVVTLLTTMFDYLEEHWEMLCDDIEKGTIDPSVRVTPELRAEFMKKIKPDPARAAELRAEFRKGFDDPIAPRIWPGLVWAYGMIGSNLKIYVQKLRRYIGDIPIHNMGYAAAEGFFAMPTELAVDDSVLLPHCIFFEFIPVGDDEDEDVEENPKTLLMDELEVGKKYEIVVTNFSGLYRYRIEDVVQVTRMYHKTPQIELLYRRNLGMNIANEKTTTEMIDAAAKQALEKAGVAAAGYSFHADYSTTSPRYCMLCEAEGDVSEQTRQALIEALDEALKEINEKYFKYRRWGMIGQPEVLLLAPKTYLDYKEMLRGKGVVLNQIKPVTILNTDERRAFFLSHAVTPSSAVDAWNAQKSKE